MRVFIADDSVLLRERLKVMLSELNEVEVIGEAEDGHQALKGIHELSPDVVILDIRMPDGNGINVLQNIKRMERDPVVIMFTNYPYPQYRKKCVELGADYFFEKSKEFEKVTETLKQLINDS